MAVRLNVILIEPATAGGAARRLAETMVGELIGRPGIDLALVGPLDRLAPDSTDRLTLDGITGDACVLDWQPAAAIHSALQAVGFLGRRTPHPHDLAASGDDPASGDLLGSSSTRRIYTYDLNRFTDAADICQALAELRAGKQVRTFSLGLTKQAQAATALRKTLPPSTSVPATPPRSPATTPDQKQRPPQKVNRSSREVLPGHRINLDDLVNQLDDYDP